MPEMDTPLDHAQEKVDASGGMGSDSGGALQPQWACKCDSIHKPPRNSLLRNRATFSAVTEANKKLFWLSVRGRMLNVYFQGPDGAEQEFLAARRGGKHRSAMTWALNGVESTLGT